MTRRALAASLPPVTASHALSAANVVPRAWLPGPELAKDTGGEGETR